MAGPLGTVGARVALAGASAPVRAEVAALLAREAPRGPAAPGSPQAAPHTLAEAEALGQQFEALLLRQLVEAMQATVPEAGLMGGASGPKTLYQDMITDALATQVARSGGLGIARLLAPALGGPAAERAGAAGQGVERAEAPIPAKQAPVPGSVAGN